MRAIDADVALSRLLEHPEILCGDCSGTHCLNCVAEMIENTPTLDVKPVIHAHWIYRKSWSKNICSNCSFESNDVTAFCPHCGATMNE
jgi:hypothetical protein